MTGRPRPFPPEAEADIGEAMGLQRAITGHYGELEPLLEARREAVTRARAKGVTLAVLAERLGISRTMVAELGKGNDDERGGREVYRSNVNRKVDES